METPEEEVGASDGLAKAGPNTGYSRPLALAGPNTSYSRPDWLKLNLTPPKAGLAKSTRLWP
jgi:hypothetical protein